MRESIHECTVSDLLHTCSDDKWWRGETQLGSGLFPVNFVSTDLNASPEPGKEMKKKMKIKNICTCACKIYFYL